MNLYIVISAFPRGHRRASRNHAKPGPDRNLPQVLWSKAGHCVYQESAHFDQAAMEETGAESGGKGKASAAGA